MKKIAHLETYGFNEQSQFNGVSNGATNEKTEKELKSINETNKAQDEQISGLKVDIKKDGNLFTISQGEKELAKIHQEEGNGSTIVSGHFDGTKILLTKDNSEEVTIDASNLVYQTDLPTKISAFENDAHYLTEHQDVSNFASKSGLATTHALAQDNHEKLETLIPGLNSVSRNVSETISMVRGINQTINEKLMPEEDIVDDSIKPVQSKAISTKFKKIDESVNQLGLRIASNEAVTEIDESIFKPVQSSTLAAAFKQVDKKIENVNNAVTANTNNINSIQQSLTNFQSDPTLNELSTNPIQNQAVATKFNAVEKMVKDLQKDKLDKGNATFTGTILNGVTDIVKAIQLLANKLDAQP